MNWKDLMVELFGVNWYKREMSILEVKRLAEEVVKAREETKNLQSKINDYIFTKTLHSEGDITDL